MATTCEECQKGMYHRVFAKPSILRLDVKEPFEMVEINCVSLPATSRGYARMVVIVDHKSKFAYASVGNKKCENIA